PLERVNNHDYWAAWAVMVTAINLQDRAMFHWAVEQYAVAASQVDSQGYLPNELRRDSRALSYHNFALQPLVMVAIFGEANGEALSALNNHSLARLVDRVLRGIDKPEIFEQVTGSEQKVDGLREPWSLAWLEPYLSRYALPASSLLDVNALRAMKNSRLGGDLTWYFYTPAKPKKVRNLSIEPFVQE
ncbi:MAG: alginate lyase family protein, partial [Gammaproteobacteria bacterium]